jgi:hypothetical protein
MFTVQDMVEGVVQTENIMDIMEENTNILLETKHERFSRQLIPVCQ